MATGAGRAGCQGGADGWIYNARPGGPFAELYQLSTGTPVDVARPARDGQVDPSRLPEYAERGLTLDPAHRITPALIQQRFPPLAPVNESCVVFNAAFFLVTGLWLTVGLVMVIRGRVPSP